MVSGHHRCRKCVKNNFENSKQIDFHTSVYNPMIRQNFAAISRVGELFSMSRNILDCEIVLRQLLFESPGILFSL